MNTTDAGAGSLRAAVSIAQSGDTVVFSLTYPATITLTSGTLSISENLTISGPGSSNLAISGNSQYTVFSIASGASVGISGITIALGGASSCNPLTCSGSGGGILNAGTLSLLSSNVINSAAYSAGGGIFNSGTMTVNGCTLSGNSTSTDPFWGGSGGGIDNQGSLTVINSVLEGNSALQGGGIANFGSLVVANSSVSGSVEGGGIFNFGTAAIIGSSVSGNSGGGIFNSAGVMTVTSSTVSANSTVGASEPWNSNGGGISNSGTLMIENSVVTSNTVGVCSCHASGGGIYNIGSLTLSNTSVLNNSVANASGAFGGGIFNSGTIFMAGALVSGNSVNGANYFLSGPTAGGGISNSGTLTLTNSTILANQANDYQAEGGGIFNTGMLVVTHGTFNRNSVIGTGSTGNGIVHNGGALMLKGTILANGSTNCSISVGPAVSAGYNLSDDASCFGLLNNTGDLNNTPAELDPNGLKGNGGPTQTVALLPNSPALDAVPIGAGGYCLAADGATPITTDQRGVSRPQGKGCDIGAFELTPYPAVLTITKYHATQMALGQQGATYVITVSNALSAGPTSGTVTVSDSLPTGLSLVAMAGAGWSCVSTTCTRNDILPAGASYPPITFTVNVAANAISPIVNTAAVSGGGSATATASDSALIVGSPVLSITASTTAFPLGEQGATYTLTVSNASGAGPTSSAVVVTNSFSSGIALVNMGGNGWSCSIGSCSRADVLAAGASYPPITATINVGSHALSPQTNIASVSGGGWANSTIFGLISIIGVPVLSIAKTHAGNFVLGQQGTYSLTVSNAASAGPTSGLVTVTETVPSGLTLISMSGTGWTCSNGGNTCIRVDVLAAGTSYPPITVTVNVAGSASSPQVNSVSVTGGGSNQANGSDTTTILQASPFFSGAISMGSGIYYLQFPNGTLFGYYGYSSSGWICHQDLGYEYVLPSGDSSNGVYFWDLSSSHWFYTNPGSFPYLYDFTLNTWLYYFPDTTNRGHYTTNPRWFANMTTGKTFTM